MNAMLDLITNVRSNLYSSYKYFFNMELIIDTQWLRSILLKETSNLFLFLSTNSNFLFVVKTIQFNNSKQRLSDATFFAKKRDKERKRVCNKPVHDERCVVAIKLIGRPNKWRGGSDEMRVKYFQNMTHCEDAQFCKYAWKASVFNVQKRSWEPAWCQGYRSKCNRRAARELVYT